MSTVIQTHTLTPEQVAIINYVAIEGTKVLINAFAGCAKTTTAREIVKHWRVMLNSGMSLHHNQRALKRFLYLVFNKDAETSAKLAFHECDKNASLVHVRTHHSLALKFFIELLRSKVRANEPVGAGVSQALANIDRKIAQLRRSDKNSDFNDPALGNDEFVEQQNEDADFEDAEYNEPAVAEDVTSTSSTELPLDLESDQLKPFGLTRGDPALEALELFCRDSDRNIDMPSAKHVAFLMPERNVSLELDAAQQQVLLRAQSAWKKTIEGRVNPKNGRLIISHEATLKLFCMLQKKSEAFIAEQYHTILFDEAQDIDVILMYWIENVRKFVCYLVGDAFQSIYNFKGALNAMAHLTNLGNNHSAGPLQLFYLSQSFRFGPSISNIANSILEVSGRFEALGCEARLSSAENVSDTKIIYVTAPPQVKRHKVERNLTRHETVSHYITDVFNELDRSISLTVLARKNNTLQTLAIELAMQNIFVTLSDKFLQKLRHGALVLTNFASLESVEGRIEFLQRVLRSVQRDNAIAQLYKVIGADGDAIRASGATPWFQFVQPLKNCGEATFAGITSRVCDQVTSELHILQLAQFIGNLDKTKTALAALLQYNETQSCEKTEPQEFVKTIQLATVHTAKGREWDDVLIMDDFPDICTLICALQWCQSNKSLSYRNQPPFPPQSVVKAQLENSIRMELLSTVPSSSDRDDAICVILRSLTSAKTFENFLHSLNEELHLYYVAITRAKKNLHIGVSLQRFRNKVQI